MSHRAAEPESRRASRQQIVLAVALAIFGALLTAVVAIGTSRGSLTGYTSASELAMTVGLTAGGGLVAIGSISSLRTSGGRVGMLASGLGIAWLAAEATGWSGGPQFARTASLLVAPMLVPLLTHLGLAYPRGRIEGIWTGRFVGFTYGAALIAGLGRVLFFDPFLDLGCWRTCAHSDLVPVPNLPLARAVEDAWWVAAFLIAAVTVLLVTRRMIMAARATRAWAWYVLIPVGAAAVAVALLAVLTFTQPTEGPEVTSFVVIFIIVATLLCLTWLGIAWGMTRLWRATRRLVSLVDELELAPAPGALREILAGSLRDDTLQVAYWLPEMDGYFDASGRSVVVQPAPGRAVTTIERRGETLGAVTHSSTLTTPDLEREIGSAARLAIDNERLRAGLLARIYELQASQGQIVELGDAARRRIERDLHDGAQQRLLALSFDLRLAVGAARNSGDAAETPLTEALEEVRLALEELRDLAHGIFPSILADAGLAEALNSMAETAILPVEVQVSPERYPAAVEMAVYLMAMEGVEVAGLRGAGHVAITAQHEGDSLAVDVEVEGGGLMTDDFIRMGDRVGAIGGVFEVAGDHLRAVIPCG